MLSGIPLPEIDEYNREYWEGCKRRELLLQRCADCGQLRFPPRPMCPECTSFNSEMVKASGRGKVISWFVAHPPVLPAFQAIAPYAGVLIELDEGPRMVSSLVDVGIDEIEWQMPVEVVFEDVSDDITLPKFKRTS